MGCGMTATRMSQLLFGVIAKWIYVAATFLSHGLRYDCDKNVAETFWSDCEVDLSSCDIPVARVAA